MWYVVIFYIIAACVCLSSLATVSVKNPVIAVVFLIFNLFFLAAFYAMQGADFMAAIQVIIYAGAILVLFMFVIMLLNMDPHLLHGKTKNLKKFFFPGLVVLGFLVLSYKIVISIPTQKAVGQVVEDNTYELGMRLFTNYLWPFELASVLILLAIVASVVIAQKN
jgi:NADH-quinone oxidoreductase subunit J